MIGYSTRRLIAVGAISGAMWFLLALTFDKGVRDFNFPVIPTNSLAASAGSVLSAVVTGVGIAVLFQHFLLVRSRTPFFLLPIVTLPSAIVSFSVLIWLTWLAFGDRAGISALQRLEDILAYPRHFLDLRPD